MLENSLVELVENIRRDGCVDICMGETLPKWCVNTSSYSFCHAGLVEFSLSS
jgi:hypothetical protein